MTIHQHYFEAKGTDLSQSLNTTKSVNCGITFINLKKKKNYQLLALILKMYENFPRIELLIKHFLSLLFWISNSQIKWNWLAIYFSILTLLILWIYFHFVLWYSNYGHSLAELIKVRHSQAFAFASLGYVKKLLELVMYNLLI